MEGREGPGIRRGEDGLRGRASDQRIPRLMYRLGTDAGLTQVELAERMGITQSAVARMEDGGTRPTLATLKLLAIAVGQEEAGGGSG